MSNPKVSMFWVTYAKDLAFWRYSIKSVKKWCTGFHEYVCAVPFGDVDAFQNAAREIGLPVQVRGFFEPQGRGFLQHAIEIFHADAYCSGDYVLHMDADVLAWERCTPSDYFPDGKPLMVRVPFECFRDYAARYSWKECVKNAIGIDPEYEVMARHPLIYPRELYAHARGAIEAKNHKSWTQYILSCKNDFPQTFAEHPTLGALALAIMPERYTIRDNGQHYYYEHGRDKFKAFWSHGGLDHINDNHPGRTARSVMDEIVS
jgi:hypothetical protein